MRLAFILSLILACASVGTAQAEGFVVPNSEVWSLTSGGGATYQIMVSRPAEPPPPGGYPVLYVLDGEDNFPIAAATAQRLARYAPRSEVWPGLVVAVGNGGQARRAHDYTPAAEGAVGRGGQAHATGGADAFLVFLAEELKPAVAARYPADPKRQTLFGHSYGGLFVLHALFSRPELFQTYVAASPSIWFGDGAVIAGERVLADRLRGGGLSPVLLLTVGDREGGGPASAPGFTIAAMAERLEALELAGLTVRHRVLTGEDHGTSSLPALAAAIGLAFGAPAP